MIARVRPPLIPTHPGKQPTLSVQGATVVLGRGERERRVVDNVSLEVAPGEIVGLVGESGSGKTTVCRLIAGLLHEGMRRGAGSIRLNGVELSELSPSVIHRIHPRGISMVFQDPLAALNPTMRIGDQIVEALATRGTRVRGVAKQMTIELLERMGVEHAATRLDAYPAELSGGQRQRVLIAMAMAADPLLLLADEPTSALDVTTQKEILALLRELALEHGVSILFVSHDYGVVAELCSRVCVMYAGQVLESGPTGTVLNQPAHPYTDGLIASLPSLERRTERLAVIPGRAPRLGERFEGCPFVPRCLAARPACSAAPMVLEPLSWSAEHRTACIRAIELGHCPERLPTRARASIRDPRGGT